ncbi:MAG: hypothetical protein QOE23_2431 [Pseudonocardiales bacterium]|jgi:hypothetical protein|nr:hypothetical protein [Pseudonocardiales bacterium]
MPGAEISTSLWSGANSVDFEVRDVTERRVDLGLLGRALTGRTFDENSATRIFLTEQGLRMLVITRTLVSRHFAVHATRRGGQSAEISVDAIESLIGKATMTIDWKLESTETISFQGETAATFAFGAVPCVIQPDRSIVFGIEVDDLTFGRGSKPPEVKPLVDEDGLLDFDDPADAVA